jgi:hypothetical protein
VVQETFTNTLNIGSSATYTFNTPLANLQNGNNILRVWNSITGDEYILNDEKVLEFNTITTSTILDFVEDFEATPTIPENWVINNSDNDITWEAIQVNTGAGGSLTQTLFVNNYLYNANGEVDTFTTEYFDLNYNGTPELQFDIAKAQYSASLSDALRVEVSVDCGQSFNEVYFKNGLNLSTVPGYQQANWIPVSTNDWRTETIDLTPYLNNDILVRFSNINGYGNSTFIDNINMIKNETLSVSENPLKNAVQIYPNPTQGLVNIALSTDYDNQYMLKVNNVIGQVVWESSSTDFNSNASESIDISKFNSGIYFVTVQVGDAKIVKKLIKL